jgi:hypothetical protein
VNPLIVLYFRYASGKLGCNLCRHWSVDLFFVVWILWSQAAVVQALPPSTSIPRSCTLTHWTPGIRTETPFCRNSRGCMPL